MKRIRLFAVLLFLALYLGALGAQAQWTWTPQTKRWINLENMPRESDELQLEYARTCLLEGNYKKALGQTKKFVQFYGDSPLSDQNQYLVGEVRQGQKHWRKAAKEFQKVITVYPETTLFDDVIAMQYKIGDRLYEKGTARADKWWIPLRKRPLKRAIEVYEMVVENQPFTPEAAEAQCKIGLCHFARREYIEAAFEYRRVIEDYAGSDWLDEAAYGLAQCHYESSLSPLYDQTSTELCIRAVDAFAERYPNDERLAELQKMRVEMREHVAEQRLRTAEFYAKRREEEAARIYYTLLVESYSDTPQAGEAQRWLDEVPVVRTDARQRVEALRAEQ